MATFENEQLGITVELDENASQTALIAYERAVRDALEDFENVTEGTLSRAVVKAAFEAGLVKRIDGPDVPRASEDVDDAPFQFNWYVSELVSNWISDLKAAAWPKKSIQENGRQEDQLSPVRRGG